VSTAPGGRPGLPAARPVARQVRAQARETAGSLSSASIVVGSSLAALALVGLFVLLDYQFAQSTQRLVKLLLGLSGIAAMAVLPQGGLLLIPIATPLLGLLPKLPVPGMNTVNVLFFTIFFSFAISQVLQRRPMARGGMLMVPLGVLLGLAGLSVIRGAAFPTGMVFDAGHSGLALFRSVMSVVPYVVVLAMSRGATSRRRLLAAVLIGFAFEVGFTFLYGRNLRGRSGGTIGQANELGTYLAMFTVLALAMGFGVRSWFGRVALWGLSIAGALGVFMSVSRGALVALALGALVVAARTSRTLLAFMLIVMATSPLWVPDYVKERVVSTITSSEDSDETEIEGGAAERLNTWKSLLRIVEDHPLDGIGFAGLAEVLPAMGEELGLRVKDSAHNTFLRMLAEIGIFGLAAFLVVWWTCWRLAARGIRAATSRFDRQVAVGLCGMIIAFALSCAFGDRFFEIMIAGNFWVVCALVEDSVREREQRS
jgi:O-antigen ligase